MLLHTPAEHCRPQKETGYIIVDCVWRECLAIVFALKQFSSDASYLPGRNFKLVTFTVAFQPENGRLS